MPKKKTINKKILIVTHSSRFHVDDVFAVATLSIFLQKKKKKFEIIRSRDPMVRVKGDYVVDTGDIYNPLENRFDHHQKGGAGKRENGILYSSFGLVWKKFGEKLCGSKKISDKVDRILVQPIDANDNGIDIVIQKDIKLYPYDMRAMIDSFRPTWKENSTFDEYFIQAVSFAKVIIERLIVETSDREAGIELVKKAYDKSKDKRLIEVKEKWPWETILNLLPEPLFVIYKVNTDKTWTLKAIRNDILNYSETRKKFPKSWAGRRGKELEKVTGVIGSEFCHNGRFIVVAKTREAILKLASMALED